MISEIYIVYEPGAVYTAYPTSFVVRRYLQENEVIKMDTSFMLVCESFLKIQSMLETMDLTRFFYTIDSRPVSALFVLQFDFYKDPTSLLDKLTQALRKPKNQML